MSTTAKERTVHVPVLHRSILVSPNASVARSVYIPAQNRKQTIVERRSTSKQRTLLVE